MHESHFVFVFCAFGLLWLPLGDRVSWYCFPRPGTPYVGSEFTVNINPDACGVCVLNAVTGMPAEVTGVSFSRVRKDQGFCPAFALRLVLLGELSCPDGSPL